MTILPDLARSAISLCDRYAAARETALRLATAGAPMAATLSEMLTLRGDLSAALNAVADLAPDDETATKWFGRAVLVGYWILDADAWSVGLAALAQGAGERATEPGEVADHG